MRKLVLVLASASLLALTSCAPSDPESTSPAPTANVEWANPDAPDIFKFHTADLVSGEQIDGTELLYKDVVMWFWAPWCPICDAEAGALTNAMAEFPDDVTVLGVAGLGDVPTANTFIEDHPGVESFPHIYDEDGSIWKGFGVTGQPTLVLINQDGRSQSYSGGYGKNDIVDKVAWLAEN